MVLSRSGVGTGRGRRGLAAAELGVVLPLFCFICAAAIDYSRAVFYAITLADCARNGAAYAADSTFAASTGYTDYTSAALADAVSLSPQPTVSKATGTDSKGNSTVTVTVSGTFTTVLKYPGIPSSVPLSSAVTMEVAPQ